MKSRTFGNCLAGFAILSVLISCSKDKSINESAGNPGGGNQPPETTMVALASYIYVDTTRPFKIYSDVAAFGCEPYLQEEKIIGEPFTDVNHNGVFDPGIDHFVASNDPATNQDLNHNGRHDGPEDLACQDWSAGIPFDDIDGNGTIRCPTDQTCPVPGDSAFARMPFVDYNGNGVWDSMPGIGVSKGKFWSYHNGPLIEFRTDSAYKFVSDSGLAYYLDGYGAGQVELGLGQFPDSLQIYAAQYPVALPRLDSMLVPSTLDDSAFYQATRVAGSRNVTRLPSLDLGDSTYEDISHFKFTLGEDASTALLWDFYFAKNRGLLKAVVRNLPVEAVGTLVPLDTALPLPLTRPAR